MYYSIQACRASAAVMVVFYHCATALADAKYFGGAAAWLRTLFAFGGTAGVSFFFVLSGFLIAHVHRRDFDKPERLPAYLRKRITRVYPTYLIVFFCVAVPSLLVPSLREAVPRDPWVLAASLLLIPQDPAVVGGSGAPVISVAWSLQYEIVFYAVFAAAILSRWLFGGLVAVLAVNYGVVHATGGHAFIQRFMANDMVLLFGMGMLSAWISHGSRQIRVPAPVAAAAGLAFFCVHLLGTAREVLLYGLCSAVLIAGLSQRERRRPRPSQPPAWSVWGDASYALYLIHYPIISLLCKLAVAIGLQGALGAAASFAMIVSFCLIAAMGFHLNVERPLLAWLTPRRPAAVDRIGHAR